MDLLDNLYPLAIGGIATFMIGLLIIVTQRWHGRWTHDDAVGVQKFHLSPTPRIGGLAIILGSGLSLALLEDHDLSQLFKPIWVAALIPFFFGFREDVTKKVSVRDRLWASLVGGAAVIFITDLYLIKVDVPGIDWMMQSVLLAMLITVIAAAGVTNAINILDGFNGLASGTSIVMLIFFGILAHQTQDPDLRDLSLLLVSVLLGFMALNYPWGKIFLGDAGAYFIGFMIAWIAILLPVRNPEISPWASLLVCIYPVTEVLYSMVRRTLQRVGSGQPDNLHLHSLIKTRIVRRYFTDLPVWFKNSLVAPSIWLASCVAGYLAMIFEKNISALMWSSLAYVIWYHITYQVLIRLPEISDVSNSKDQNGN